MAKLKLIFVMMLTNHTVMGSENQVLNIFYGSSKYPPYHFQASGDIHASFNHLVRGHLLNLDENFNLKPGLIKNFKYHYEDSAFILTMRDNIYFHNGRKANAKDLEFSILRGFFSSKQNFFKNRFGDIVGVDKIVPGSKFEYGKVDGFKVLNQNKIKIKLNNYDPNFLFNFNAAYYSLIPQEEMSDDYLTWKKYPVGAGEYKFLEQDNKNSCVVLVHIKTGKKIKIYYGDKKPDIIDLSYKPVPKFEIYQSKLSSAIRILEFSNQNELSRYQEFREALELIIDREVYRKNSFGLVPSNSLVPYHFLKVNKIKDDFSIEKAKELVSKIPPEILQKKHKAIVYSGVKLSQLHKFVIGPIQTNLKKIGIDMDFLPYTKKFIDQSAANEYVMRFFAKITNYTNPLILFGSYNFQGHDNYLAPLEKYKPKFNHLYNKVQEEQSTSEKFKLIRRLNEYSVENKIIIPIVEEYSTYFLNPNRVKKMGDQPSPLDLYFENIELK